MNWDGYERKALYASGEEGVEPDENVDVFISPTTIESMMLCPARVGQSRDPGFVDVPSEAMLFGTLIHALAERVVDEKFTAELLTDDGMLTLWRELAEDDDVDLETLAPKSVLENDLEEARFAITQFRAWWEVERRSRRWGDWKVEAVEGKIVKPLGVIPPNRVVWLRGIPDLVIKFNSKMKIYDWKTANRGWNEGRALVKIQGPIYVYLVAGDIEEDVDVDFVVYDRQKRKWVRHPVTVTPATVQAAKRTAWQWALMIASGAFPATPGGESYGKYRRGWHCSAKYCGAWNICPFKGLIPDDRNLEEKIDYTW